MKRFLMFSVSILCLSIAVLIGFYVGSQRVEAQVSANKIQSYPDFIVMSGNTDRINPNDYQQFSYPKYSDGSSATEEECHIIISTYMGGGSDVLSAHIQYLDNGFRIMNPDMSRYQYVYYLVICTRNEHPVATDQSTWGNVKGLKE